MIRSLIAPYLIQIVGGLALVAAIAAGVQTVRLWKLKADTADDAAQLAVCRGANAAQTATLRALEEQRQRDEEARKAAAAEARRALDVAEEARKKAQQEANAWKRRWEGRPQSCAIALTQMEAACAGSLSDY